MCDTAPESSINAPFDPAYYTWSLLFKAMIGRASDLEVKKYIHNKSLLDEEKDCKRCDDWRDWLFQYSPTIHFLKQNLEKLGANVDKNNVICRRCDTLSSTGIKQAAFNPDHGILLCANHVKSRGNMEDVLAHEMVHAYDFMRFKYDKWNLKHVACTEVCHYHANQIRANLLSGECRWTREFFQKGQYKLTQHFQECVRRRAVLSVSTHGACKSNEQAAKVVDEVWGSCFSDTRPFDEIYR